MGSPLVKHVSSLHKSFFLKFIAILGCFAWFSSTSQKYSTVIIFHTHEVSRNLYIHNIGAVGVSSEVVHKQVVGVVNEEVESVEHVSVVNDPWHLDGVLHHLLYLVLCPLLVLN